MIFINLHAIFYLDYKLQITNYHLSTNRSTKEVMNENEKIKKIRKELGLTQQEMADSIGVSKQYLSKVENGLTELSKEKITKLCNYYGISLDWILSDKGGMLIRENEIINSLTTDIDSIHGISAILGAFSIYIEIIFPVIEEEHPKALMKDKISTVQSLFINDLFKSDYIKKSYTEIINILNKKLSESDYKDKILNTYYKAFVQRCESND